MERLYEKLKAMDPKHFDLLQIIVGVLSGLICWAAIIIPTVLGSEDQLLQWAFLILFAVIMILSNRIRNGTGLSVKKFRICLCIGLGIGIIAFLVYGLISGEMFTGKIFK